MSGARELLHVVAIPLMIPLKLGQGYVVSLKREKSQMGPISREHGYEPSFVVLGRGGDGNSIEIKLVLPMQRRTPSRDFSEQALHIWDDRPKNQCRLWFAPRHRAE